jgi:hypothetical protein
MDFIKGFPRVNGKFVILTIVDWLSKYVHFIPLDHPYTTTSVAWAFFNNIAHLHCIPSSIVRHLHQHVLEGAVHAAYYADEGITRHFLAPCTPQQNGGGGAVKSDSGGNGVGAPKTTEDAGEILGGGRGHRSLPTESAPDEESRRSHTL